MPYQSSLGKSTERGLSVTGFESPRFIQEECDITVEREGQKVMIVCQNKGAFPSTWTIAMTPEEALEVFKGLGYALYDLSEENNPPE